MRAVDVTVSNGDMHATGNPFSCRGHAVMRALTLVADRQLVVADVPAPSESRQVFGKIIVYF
jgi:hypothetical protein